MGPELNTKAKEGLLKQISLSLLYVHVKEMGDKKDHILPKISEYKIAIRQKVLRNMNVSTIKLWSNINASYI